MWFPNVFAVDSRSISVARWVQQPSERRDLQRRGYGLASLISLPGVLHGVGLAPYGDEGGLPAPSCAPYPQGFP